MLRYVSSCSMDIMCVDMKIQLQYMQYSAEQGVVML